MADLRECPPPPPHILQNLQKFKTYSVSGTSIHFSLHSLFTPPYSTPLIQFPFLTHCPRYSLPLLTHSPLYSLFPLYTPPLPYSLVCYPLPPLYLLPPYSLPPLYSLSLLFTPPTPPPTHSPLFNFFLSTPPLPATHSPLIHSFSYPPYPPSPLLTPSLFTPLPLTMESGSTTD